MNKSDRDPDAYDRIRDDKLMEWNAKLQKQAARIAELEAQLAEDKEWHEQHRVDCSGFSILEWQDLYLAKESALKIAEMQLADATERERDKGHGLHNLENEIFRIGRHLRDYEIDDAEQESIGKELIFLSTFCDNCRGTGEDGDPPDANGEGGAIYACETCEGTGRNAAALAAAQQEGGAMRVTLALFSNDKGQEYVVIVTEDVSYDEHAEPGYTVRAEWTMGVSESTITMFPTDRPLRADEWQPDSDGQEGSDDTRQGD